MTAPTLTGGVAERARLLDLLSEVAEKVDALQLRQSQLAAELVGNAGAIIHAREDAIEGQEGADRKVAALKKKRGALTSELEDVRDDLAAAGTVSERAQRSIEKVLVEQTTDFVRWAAAYSAEAEQRLADLHEAYTAAVDAWGEAEAVWRPITVAAGLGEVPKCPLPPAPEVFGDVRAAPAHLKDADLASVELAVWKQLPGGLLRSFPADAADVHEDYATRAAWTLVKGEPALSEQARSVLAQYDRDER